MSYKINPPIPWQNFLNLRENKNVPLLEVKRRYIKQQLLFENAYISYQQSIMHGKVQGGKKTTETVEGELLLTENNNFIVTEGGDFLEIN